jgi:hypothetical protein
MFKVLLSQVVPHFQNETDFSICLLLLNPFPTQRWFISALVCLFICHLPSVICHLSPALCHLSLSGSFFVSVCILMAIMHAVSSSDNLLQDHLFFDDPFVSLNELLSVDAIGLSNKTLVYLYFVTICLTVKDTH